MQSSFSDLENRYDLLDEIGDPLLRLDAVIDWELFREVLKGLDKVERKLCGRSQAVGSGVDVQGSGIAATLQSGR